VELICSFFGSLGSENSFAATCCSCIAGGLRYLKEMFSRYALSYAAIYGMDFQTSAKSLFDMMRKRGVRVIVNDLLVDRVLSVGGLAVGLINIGMTNILTTGIAVLYLVVAQEEALRINGSEYAQLIQNYYMMYRVVFCLASFYIGVLLFSVVSTMVTSGVATTFVCLAEDPQVLQNCNPILYEKVHKGTRKLNPSLSKHLYSASLDMCLFACKYIYSLSFWRKCRGCLSTRSTPESFFLQI
jgi:Plasma-membrane choline transporter